jgi:hypothetical protein
MSIDIRCQRKDHTFDRPLQSVRSAALAKQRQPHISHLAVCHVLCGRPKHTQHLLSLRSLLGHLHDRQGGKRHAGRKR